MTTKQNAMERIHVTVLVALVMTGCLQTEEQEAEALFAERLLRELAEHQPYSDAVQQSQTGTRLASSITDCLERHAVGLYGLELHVSVHADGLVLRQLRGAEPLLPTTARQACLTELISTTRAPLLEVLADSEFPRIEMHLLRLFRDSAGQISTEVQASVSTGEFTPLHPELMPLVTDDIVFEGTPWEEQELPAALLACEAAGLPQQADPLFLSFYLLVSGRPTEQGSCRLATDDLRSAYTDCLCDVLLDSAHRADGELKVTRHISEATPDGRTVSSTETMEPTRSRVWHRLLRRTENGAIRYRIFSHDATPVPAF